MKTILQIAEEEGATVNEMSSDGDMNLCFTESTLERFAARIRAEQKEIPDVLFDGYAVYQKILETRGELNMRTSPENVSDVLDAAVSLIRNSKD